MSLRKEVPKIVEINPYLKKHEINKPISKCISLFFKVTYIVFALDYGFITHKNKKINTFFKYYPVIQSFIVSVVLVLLVYNYVVLQFYSSLWVTEFVIKICIYPCIILYKRGNSTLVDLMIKLKVIDKKLMKKTEYFKFDLKFFIAFCLMLSVIFMYLVVIIKKTPSFSNDTPFIVLIILYLLLNDAIIASVNYIIYECFRCRLQRINVCLKSDSKINILHLINIYKLLAGLLEEVNRIQEVMCTTALFTNVPNLMLLLYQTMFGSKESRKFFVHQLFLVIITCLQMFAPALPAALVYAETKEMSATLHEMKMTERLSFGKSRLQEIDLFIGYIEDRPFKINILKVIPLGWEVPVIILDICVNYIIIIAQLKNVKL